ncbi:efflux RND transporter periplasmic adaptor subunit [Peribacillus asahii]|uniref:efflux RND transporter periplasmic adaptor subunit n=1 Tax=Peribacillus asahii TaxID=228899 RepID=UPI003817E255
MRKWIILGLVLILIIGGSTWFFIGRDSEPAVAKAITATVQKGDLQVSVDGSGSVEAANSEDVIASVSSEVDEVLVEKNEIVEKGEELITFTDGSDPITAPFAGTVTTIDVEAGDRVASQDVVAHVTNYKKLQTVISVDELDVSSVKKGQQVELTASAFEDEKYTGKVKTVAKEGTYENGVSSFDVTISIDKPGDLRVGMSTEAKVLTKSAEDTLYVPIEAVQLDGEERYVNLATSDSEDASTTKQVVETGMNNEKYIEITSGLKEGDIVSLPITISNGSNTSGKDGMKGMPGGGMSSGGMPSGGPSGGGMPNGGSGGPSGGLGGER